MHLSHKNSYSNQIMCISGNNDPFPLFIYFLFSSFCLLCSVMNYTTLKTNYNTLFSSLGS